MSKIKKPTSKVLIVFFTLFFVLSYAVISAPTAPVQAFTAANADAAMTALNNVFWDPVKKYFYCNSDHLVHSEHAHGPEGGKYTDFWWEAQLWDTVMDAYQRTGSATYLQQIHDVYDGFIAYYPTFQNDFNDDKGWWALACARAYEITGQTRYKTQAKTLFDGIYSHWDSTYGGGVWWKCNGVHDQKNVCTNATAAITAVKIANMYSDATYVTKAQNLYNWVKNTLTDGNGHVYDHMEGGGAGTQVKWDFSYNFGTFIGAGVALYVKTGTASYRTDAINAANWAKNYLNLSTTMMYEGVNDGAGFKAIFFRYLNELVTQCGQTQYLAYMRDNATQAWNHRRTSDNITGPDWSATAPSTYLQSMTAAAAVSLMNRVSADNYTGNVPGSGAYEAENAIVSGISSESTQAGFTGRGYLAGWNTNGTYVEFKLNVYNAGNYKIKLRYAAGAGNATRYLVKNGAAYINNQSFAGTGAWNSYNTVTLNNVPLNAGSNTFRVAYDTSKGSSNYLNLDNITVYPMFEAENGVLHSLTVESTNAGFTGTGYLAGWNTNNQWVDFNVSVAKAGTYTLNLRYAGGAGNASRYIYVNGAGVVTNLSFPGTGAWTTYSQVSCSIPLNAGANTISVIFDSSKGSTNWLNLDHIEVVQPAP